MWACAEKYVQTWGTGMCRVVGHNYEGHNFEGHNYAGHNYEGHDHVGHNYIGYSYMGHNYVGHNYICHNYMGHMVCSCRRRRTRRSTIASSPSPTASTS